VLSELRDGLGDAAQGGVVFQALDHLGLGRQEHLEQPACLLRARLAFAGVADRHAVPLGLVAGGQQLLTGQRPGNARRGRHAPDLRAGRRQRPGGEREQKQTCGTQRHGDSPILWCSQLAGEKRQKIGILPAARGLLLEAR
jgi:hypothetical protein